MSRPWPLRLHLLALTLACTLPIMILAGLLAFQFVSEEHHRIQADVAERLRLMRIAVELRLDNLIEDLQVLAASPTLQDGRLDEFRRHLVDANTVYGGTGSALSRPDGQEVVSTGLQAGAPLPRRADLETQNRVLATGRPQVSDLVSATTAGEQIITVEVPVRTDGEVRYVLAMGVSPNYLSELLRAHIPKDWIGSIVDRRGIVIARTSDAAGNVIGHSTIPEVAANLNEGSAFWIKAMSRLGMPTYVSFLKSDRLGWTINIGVPRTVVEGPIWRAIALLLGIGLLAIVLSVAAAVATARRILGGLSALGHQVDALGRGETPSAERSSVSEIDRMQLVLSRVSEDLHRALKQKNVLIAEINHRVKNTLATVQSIARLTRSSAANVSEFVASFERRLVGLSRAYNLLTETSWTGADLKSIVERILAPYLQSGRLKITGPSVHLSSNLAVAVAAAIQEMSTNAAKYGALSGDRGRVDIAWELAPDGKVRFRWTESGGPPVKPPTRRGFGTKLIQELLAHDTGWDVELDYAESGFRCLVTIDTTAAVEAEAPLM
jgi:two-component sensor histidine kinase